MERLTFTVKEASEILGISESKMYDLCRQRVVPNIQVGRRFVIPKQPYIDWILNIKGGETVYAR